MNQKKAKFNIVDVIVLAVLIVGIAFVAMRMFGNGAPADNDSTPTGGSGPYRVTFFAESVPEAVANTLVQGSKAENASRNVDLGTLVEFHIDESIAYAADSKGNMVQTTKPGYVSVTMVCELTGMDQSTGLQVGQFMLNVGHSMGVRAGFTEINTYIIAIEPVAAR